MAHVAVATQQTIWDCKYSRLGHRLSDADETGQAAPVWVCIRTGERRPVTETDCDGCEHWMHDEDTTPCP